MLEGKYILFGAGQFGQYAVDLLGVENISFFVDNNPEKQNKGFMGKEVVSLQKAINMIRNEMVVIAVSEQYITEIKTQLEEFGIKNYKTYQALKFDITREKILSRIDYIDVYHKAINWIKNNTVEGEGIINNTSLRKAYPEVSGYYIPTLLRWGYRDIAVRYAKWLCKIQRSDGAWCDTAGNTPYVFDSAQILKGLLAIREICPEVDESILKGCDWLLSNMTEEGRLLSPRKNAWGDGKTISELIHTYCISPVKEAGEIFKRVDYIEKAKKIAGYYISECREQILDFGLLSHFYAYVVEAMLDIGERDLAKQAMNRISKLQRESGAVPGYKNVDWVCSTGLFQLSMVWYRLDEIENADKAFEYACKLQNDSGGWYGSYLSETNPNELNTYFPDAEISWANKYFLDALYYKNIAMFEKQASGFLDFIDKNDGRYQCIKSIVEEASNDVETKVLDVGCGKGRYLKNLAVDVPNIKYYATDLSLTVMEYINLDFVDKKQGNLTNLPYKDNTFDVVYTCEALEHAVDISSAIKEMCRVTKPGGRVGIVDKNKGMLGYFSIEEWEQWFEEEELRRELLQYCSEVEVIKKIEWDGNPANDLFYCWIGKKNNVKERN